METVDFTAHVTHDTVENFDDFYVIERDANVGRTDGFLKQKFHFVFIHRIPIVSHIPQVSLVRKLIQLDPLRFCQREGSCNDDRCNRERVKIKSGSHPLSY